MPTNSRPPIRYALWLWRTITWDGVLPLFLFALPHAIRAAFPQFDADDAKMVLIAPPVVALFVRLLVGCHYINTNGCSDRCRSYQQLALVGGIFLLSQSDVQMARSVLDAGNADDRAGAVALSLALFALALPLLIWAMYPGRLLRSAETQQIGNWQVER